MSKELQTNSNKAKELCNKGICVSMSEARRLLTIMPKEKLDKLIAKKLNEKGEQTN